MEIFNAPETPISHPGSEEVVTASPITGDHAAPVTATEPEAAAEPSTATEQVATAEQTCAGRDFLSSTSSPQDPPDEARGDSGGNGHKHAQRMLERTRARRLGAQDEESRDHNHAIAHMGVKAHWQITDGKKSGVSIVPTEPTEQLIYVDGAARITGAFGQATWAFIATDGRQCRGWGESDEAAPQYVGASRNTIMAGN